jgi:predicted transcriptional regulator
MSTTTIRLPDDLKARVAKIADAAGLTAHGFMLHAIEEQTAQAEAQAAMHRVASERLQAFRQTGKAIPWNEARQYLADRAAGKDAPRPRARKIAR